MIIKFDEDDGIDSFRNKLAKAFYDGDEDAELSGEEPFYIEDGVYFSKNKPIFSGSKKFPIKEFDTEKDYFANPYDTDGLIVWKNEKPIEIEGYEGQNNYGSASIIPVKEAGYVTVCAEDD